MAGIMLGQDRPQGRTVFRELGSVAAVVAKRGLKPGTIRGHLLAFVRRGELGAREVCGLPEIGRAHV